MIPTLEIELEELLKNKKIDIYPYSTNNDYKLYLYFIDQNSNYKEIHKLNFTDKNIKYKIVAFNLGHLGYEFRIYIKSDISIRDFISLYNINYNNINFSGVISLCNNINANINKLELEINSIKNRKLYLDNILNNLHLEFE